MEKQRCDERRNRRIGVEMEKTTGSQTQSLTEEMKTAKEHIQAFSPMVAGVGAEHEPLGPTRAEPPITNRNEGSPGQTLSSSRRHSPPPAASGQENARSTAWGSKISTYANGGRPDEEPGRAGERGSVGQGGWQLEAAARARKIGGIAGSEEVSLDQFEAARRERVRWRNGGD
uniref:Uncharacterized protein n=1 Tax=Oryza nivara TaxID=4536 RepID=A0A0E0IZD1_ORYNI